MLILLHCQILTHFLFFSIILLLYSHFTRIKLIFNDSTQFLSILFFLRDHSRLFFICYQTKIFLFLEAQFCTKLNDRSVTIFIIRFMSSICNFFYFAKYQNISFEVTLNAINMFDTKKKNNCKIVSVSKYMINVWYAFILKQHALNHNYSDDEEWDDNEMDVCD